MLQTSRPGVQDLPPGWLWIWRRRQREVARRPWWWERWFAPDTQVRQAALDELLPMILDGVPPRLLLLRT